MSKSTDAEQWVIKRLVNGGRKKGLPPYLIELLEKYLRVGDLPGGFLTAVVSDKLAEAAGRADVDNLAALGRWGELMYFYFPECARGSMDKVDAWIKHRGYSGMDKEVRHG